MERPRSSLAGAIAVVLAHVLPFPACDPANLKDQQRLLVTGTTDVGNLTLTAAPTTLLVEGETTITFRVTSASTGNASFSGRIDLALSGLPPEVELARDLEPRSFRISGNNTQDGTFVLRAVDTRVDPATLLLTMTSTGDGGSVVVHPPVAIRLTARSALQVTCQRTPDEGPAPLAVAFTAQASNCEGACRFAWDFGDGGRDDTRNPSWTYRSPGLYAATVRLTDDRPGVTATCNRTVRVLDRGSSPSTPSTPGPTPTATPSIHLTVP
jgi:PKD repeat protein